MPTSAELTRVAVIYDIHGNLPALQATLNEIRAAAVEEIVVGGDIFPGPMATEVLSHLKRSEVPIRFITGNGDRVVLAAKSGADISEVPQAYQTAIRWNAQSLEPGDAKAIAKWPATLQMDVKGLGSVLFCHATPRNDTEIFTRLTSDDRLLPVFSATAARLVVCGHTHMQFDRTVGSTRVVNAGSVGMPFGRPGAYWLLLGPGVELRRTDYDLASAADRIRATAYPGAEEFARRSILQPPSEEEMLAAYGRVEVGYLAS